MRTFSTTVMALLVIAALFWGNCFSCPLTFQAESHGCCHRSQQTAKRCETQVLRHFVKVDPGAQPHVDVLPGVQVPAVETTVCTWHVLTPAADPTPPDRIPLHSSLRI